MYLLGEKGIQEMGKNAPMKTLYLGTMILQYLEFLYI